MAIVRADPEQTALMNAAARELEAFMRGTAALAIARFDAFSKSLLQSAMAMGGSRSNELIRYIVGDHWLSQWNAFQNSNVKQFIDVVQGLDSGRYELIGWQGTEEDPIVLGVARKGSVKLPPQSMQGLGVFPVLGALIVIGGLAVASGAVWVVADAFSTAREDATKADLIRAGMQAAMTAKLASMPPDDAKKLSDAIAKANDAVDKASPDSWFARAAKDVAGVATGAISDLAGGPVGAIILLALLGAAYFENRGRRR